MHLNHNRWMTGRRPAMWGAILGVLAMTNTPVQGQDAEPGGTKVTFFNTAWGAMPLRLIPDDKGMRDFDGSKFTLLYTTLVPIPGNRVPDDNDKLIKIILEELERRKAEARKPGPPFVVLPDPKKKPGAPPKKPKPPELDPAFFDELIKQLREERKKVRIKRGPGGIKLVPLPPPPGPNVKLPASGGWIFNPPPKNETGGGTVIIDEVEDRYEFIRKTPYIPKRKFRQPQDILIIMTEKFLIKEEPGDGDGSLNANATGTETPPPQAPLKSLAPPDDATNSQAAVFPEDGDEWFATLGAGIRQAGFEMELKPAPILGRLGNLPASSTTLPFTGSSEWLTQVPDQQPKTRIRLDDGTLIIDPRSDFERNQTEYANFLEVLRLFGGTKGYENDAIRNFELTQSVNSSARQFDFDEDSFQGSVMLGYRRGCYSLPDDDGRFYWQGGLTFSWADEVSLSTPYVPTWSNGIITNYNRTLNEQRSALADRFEPINQISLVGYQAAELDLDSQALALFFGAGYQFACGCRLSLNLMGGYAFQQWDLTERARVDANGRRILNGEKKSSGNDAVPTFSAMLEAAYPLTRRTEIILYGGTTFAAGNQGRIDTDTIRFSYDSGAFTTNYVGLGMSVRF